MRTAQLRRSGEPVAFLRPRFFTGAPGFAQVFNVRERVRSRTGIAG